MPIKTVINTLLLSLAVTLNSFAESSDWTEIAEADLFLMGEYEGNWVNPPEGTYMEINPTLSAQVINVDVGNYRVRFIQDLNRRADPYFEVDATVMGDEIVCRDQGVSFVLNKGGLKGDAVIDGHLIAFELERVVRVSPTMGRGAPDGAVILMDGSGLDAWEHEDGRANTWSLLENGIMQVHPTDYSENGDSTVGGNIVSKQLFNDVELHLEFRYPVEPGKTGQGRGNSGLFFMGWAYEAQILNSFGLTGHWREAGSLYKLSPPKVNAARPPLQWQTYDVKFTAPIYEGDEKVANARISVWLNDILVQNDVELIYKTQHVEAERYTPAPKEPGPIMLQDHGNLIQFRNIWVKENS